MVTTKNMSSNEIEEEQKEANKTRKKTPPNFISRLLYLWIVRLFYYGNRRDLEFEDLVPSQSVYNSKLLGDLLERNWLQEQDTAKSKEEQASFVKVLLKTFIWSYLPGGVMQFLYVGLRIGSPLLFARLLDYWSVNSTMSRTVAAYYAAGLVLAKCLGAFFNYQGNFYCQLFGMKIRIAASSLIFRKIMRMNNSSLGETTAGKVVNLLSNDLRRCDIAFVFMHYVWIIPLQLTALCYLGYIQAGLAAIIGFVTLIIIALPIQGVLGQLLGKIRLRTAEKTDERIKVMSEVINGIQVIKMYAWEIPFQKLVGQKRYEELKEIKLSATTRMFFLGFTIFAERAAIFASILSFILFGNVISANIVYPLQQFIHSAQVNITLVLPLVLSFTAELFVSLARVQEFLNLEERPALQAIAAAPASNLSHNVKGSLEKFKNPSINPVFCDNKADNCGSNIRKNLHRKLSLFNEIAVEVDDVSASWTGDPNFLALKNISLRIPQGKLCAIIGAVGSGKSSVLQLLLKELPAGTGRLSVFGDISYACQEAWLFPNTVRENILFGLPFDPDKYKKICKVCTLEKDFKQLPYGDQTFVGERGVSLSGGQRARINLARAVYREADIYLLDDPLSAVDANVGRLLFEGCINGYLKGRTRILVTHQIHFLKATDYIIVLNEGGIESMGTFDELISSAKVAKILSSLQEGKNKGIESINSSKSSGDTSKIFRRISITNTEDQTEVFEKQKMAAEERQSGGLRWEVVYSYITSGGSILFILFNIFMILLTSASASGADYWISYWLNQMVIYEHETGAADMDPGLDVQIGSFTTGQYLLIEGSIVIVTIILTHLRVIFFTKLCFNACKNLHDRMFSSLIKGIMRFFDTSSSGRILNRFTKDMSELDEFLPRSLLDILQVFCSLMFILILNAVALYWTVIPSVILIIFVIAMVKLYLRTAQSIKRLEGTTKSPVFDMVTSCLSGIATIRSANAQQRLVNEFDEYQDHHTTAWHSYLGGGSSFAFYMDTLCQMYLATIIFVFLYNDFGSVIAVGSVGLAITQTNLLTMSLQYGTRMLVDFLAQFTSVERVLEYTRIEAETNLYEGQMALPPTWPSQGTVLFQDVFMKYAPDELPVLKNINMFIESGWKVGIVGRTGAGKSSLISALFRFAFIEGKIMIDGIDTSQVSKQALRSKISIIPQEPVLFSATIRYNLDPFDNYSDDELWQALEQVDLKSAVLSLDFKVTEGGTNFSVGQRQLMCLARAVLRSNKILIMDEATANVDPQTDNFIQQTIRRQFASCTVLTIAHRLNTVMDSDRVLVMSNGEIIEFDHPYILLSDPNSHFSSMVKENGEKISEQLFETAKETYFKRNMKENLG